MNRLNKFAVALFALSVILSLSGCKAETSDPDVIDASTETNGVTSFVKTIETESEKTIGLEDTIYGLIRAYVDGENNVCVDMTNWQVSEDYDLFRRYFFGEWSAPDGSFIIDDSELFFGMQQHIYYFKEFYQISETVLAFSMGSNAEGLIFWLETDAPDRMYKVGLEWYGWLLVDDTSFEYAIVKTDASANDPTDNFLSVFKLHEMARDHGMEFDLLTNIDCGFIDGKHIHHSATYDFYPMYLVSETDDKIVIRTSVGNIGDADLKPINVLCTFEKDDGEWVRTIEEV